MTTKRSRRHNNKRLHHKLLFALVALAGMSIAPLVLVTKSHAHLTNVALDSTLLPPTISKIDLTGDSSLLVKTDTCFVFWFGPPMEGARKEAFEKMKELIEYDGVSVQLVTHDNLSSFENPDSPMHPAAILQPGLSGVHMSDYLRGYFMHNHGGCYHDVKVLAGPPKLGKLFERMARNESIYLIGAKEGGPDDVGCDGRYTLSLNTTCVQVGESWKRLVSGMYCVRKQTEFTERWTTLVEDRLTEKYETLKEHPSPVPGRCCRGQDTKGYPFYWTELGGSALHPVESVFSDHVQFGFPWYDRRANCRSHVAEDRPRWVWALSER